MSIIYLIRHGESQSNAGLPTLCPKNIELTEQGIEQAKCIAKFLTSQPPPELIVISSYRRAKQTAAPTQLLFPSVPEQEWPVHEFTYLSSMHDEASTVEERRPMVDAYWEQLDPYFVESPGSESFEQFIMRVREVMQYLKSTEYKTIAIFSHEQFIDAVLWLSEREPLQVCQKTMRDFSDFRKSYPMPNGTIVGLQFRDIQERWQYELITSHLKRLSAAAPIAQR